MRSQRAHGIIVAILGVVGLALTAHAQLANCEQPFNCTGPAPANATVVRGAWAAWCAADPACALQYGQSDGLDQPAFDQLLAIVAPDATLELYWPLDALLCANTYEEAAEAATVGYLVRQYALQNPCGFGEAFVPPDCVLSSDSGANQNMTNVQLLNGLLSVTIFLAFVYIALEVWRTSLRQPVQPERKNE